MVVLFVIALLIGFGFSIPSPCAIFGSVELATDEDLCINNFSKSAKGGDDKWAEYVLPGNWTKITQNAFITIVAR